MIYDVTNTTYDTWVEGVQHFPELPSTFTVDVGDDDDDPATAILKAIEEDWLVETFDYQPRDRSQLTRTIKVGFDFEAHGIERSDPERMLKWMQAMKARRAA